MNYQQIFLEWLRWSLNQVTEGYYNHSERVFCYELYHLIRVKMFLYERGGGNLDNIYLHSEIIKLTLSETEANYYNITPLTGQRSPDFVLHQPHNANYQIAAMEVKANNLTYEELLDDLEKLTQLKNRYNFQVVVFLAINIDASRLRTFITDDFINSNNIDHDIKIIVKEDAHHPFTERTIAEYIT